ncbi:MAG: glycosyltransferase family 4 protein [Candidatus Hydrothermarchaeales archaeon]
MVTHVTNLVEKSKNDFTILTYGDEGNEGVLGARYIDVPILRALSFTISGFFKGKNADFDAIHAHYAVPQGLLGVILKKVGKKPLVVTLHGSDVTILSRNIFTRPIIKYVLKNADKIITVSEFLRDEVLNLGIKKEKVTTIYAGVSADVGDRESKIDGETVAFIGALVRQKGVDILIRAFKMVKERLPKAKLIIIGDGKERSSLEELAKDLRLEDVQFRGYYGELKGIFGESSLLVLPSREEGFGLVLLEAMNHGVPIIASRIGGIKEIVQNGYNGILVQKENPGELSRAIVKILEDEELRTKLTRNGREFVKRFSWEKMADEVDEIYEELAG